MSMKRRSSPTAPPDIHWPAGFDPAKADLFRPQRLDHQRVLRASLEPYRRRQQLADLVPPTPRMSRSRAGDPVPPGRARCFRWTTFGLAIESKVHESVPEPAPGLVRLMAPGTPPTFLSLLGTSKPRNAHVPCGHG